MYIVICYYTIVCLATTNTNTAITTYINVAQTSTLSRLLMMLYVIIISYSGY